MTKRDVAVWFCKVVAIYGSLNAIFNLIGNLGTYWSSNTLPWQILVYPLSSLVLYPFVYLFAEGIGTELAAEGENGVPMTSSADLRPLLLRCVGFGLLLGSSLALAFSALNVGSYYFSGSSPRAINPFISRFAFQCAAQLLASAIGFALAFGPRIRAAMQSR